MHRPKYILLMSGKRKCGKDYIATLLLEKLKNASIVRISGPLKGQYAKEHKLDHSELMTDGPYKELHRKAMIEWSDEIRSKQSGFFCEIACNNALESDVWIVSDIRRKTDIEWFLSEFGGNGVVIKTIRVVCNDNVRSERGWVFTKGVDDVTSECDLDDYEKDKCWDLVINNELSSSEVIDINIGKILSLIED